MDFNSGSGKSKESKGGDRGRIHAQWTGEKEGFTRCGSDAKRIPTRNSWLKVISQRFEASGYEQDERRVVAGSVFFTRSPSST